jgi:hypothetical protein
MSKKSLSIGLCFLALTAMGVASCKDGGGGGGKKSQRLRWVEEPTAGKTTGKKITIEGIDITFETPEVLYVYKECTEAAHSPEGPDKEWIPVIRCETAARGGEEDEFAEESEGLALTIYAAAKTAVINERTVETFRSRFQNAGYVVDDINFVEDYMGKEGRRGIEAQVHLMDSSTGYPSREIRRFMFPKGDVLFIAHIDYPYGDDRSGINSDWQRILWNFQYIEESQAAKAEAAAGEEAAEE